MKTIFDIPAQQEELDAAIADPQPKHVWHDVPANRYVIYTDQDIPQVENSNE